MNENTKQFPTFPNKYPFGAVKYIFSWKWFASVLQYWDLNILSYCKPRKCSKWITFWLIFRYPCLANSKSFSSAKKKKDLKKL